MVLALCLFFKNVLEIYSEISMNESDRIFTFASEESLGMAGGSIDETR